MIYQYTIPAIPPSNNRYIGRNNRFDYKDVKGQWELLIRGVCKPLPPVPINRSILTLVYYFPNHIRRDPDNFSGKMILDGFVKAGVIVDDSFSHIELRLKAAYSKNNPHTEIYVKEIIEAE